MFIYWLLTVGVFVLLQLRRRRPLFINAVVTPPWRHHRNRWRRTPRLMTSSHISPTSSPSSAIRDVSSKASNCLLTVNTWRRRNASVFRGTTTRRRGNPSTVNCRTLVMRSRTTKRTRTSELSRRSGGPQGCGTYGLRRCTGLGQVNLPGDLPDLNPYWYLAGPALGALFSWWENWSPGIRGTSIGSRLLMLWQSENCTVYELMV